MKQAVAIIFLSMAALFGGCATSDAGADREAGTSGKIEASQTNNGQTDDGQTDIGKTGGMCGGIAGFQCADSADYCATERGACYRTADVAGQCTPKPQACTREFRPVCGCDGETYPNACSAAAKGASVAYEGRCTD